VRKHVGVDGGTVVEIEAETGKVLHAQVAIEINGGPCDPFG